MTYLTQELLARTKRKQEARIEYERKEKAEQLAAGVLSNLTARELVKVPELTGPTPADTSAAELEAAHTRGDVPLAMHERLDPAEWERLAVLASEWAAQLADIERIQKAIRKAEWNLMDAERPRVSAIDTAAAAAKALGEAVSPPSPVVSSQPQGSPLEFRAQISGLKRRLEAAKGATDTAYDRYNYARRFILERVAKAALRRYSAAMAIAKAEREILSGACSFGVELPGEHTHSPEFKNGWGVNAAFQAEEEKRLKQAPKYINWQAER